jgi:hypothetical protein
MLAREKQPDNIWAIFVTAAVLNNGTPAKAVQFKNI